MSLDYKRKQVTSPARPPKFPILRISTLNVWKSEVDAEPDKTLNYELLTLTSKELHFIANLPCTCPHERAKYFAGHEGHKCQEALMHPNIFISLVKLTKIVTVIGKEGPLTGLMERRSIQDWNVLNIHVHIVEHFKFLTSKVNVGNE